MKSNLRNLLMVATAIFSICGSAQASTSKVKEASWLPSNLKVAAIDEDESPKANVADIEEGIYYIRNSEAGTFLAGGNSWGTRLSLKSAGDMIKLTKQTGTEIGFIMQDVSVRGGNTGLEIGEASTVDLFIDQHSPSSGYIFHKLTAEEIAAIDADENTHFAEGVGKSYYYISYTNMYGKTVYLAEGGFPEDADTKSGHHEVSGIEIDPKVGRPEKNAIWELFTRNELAIDLFQNADEKEFLSATPFLDNPDFSRNLHSSVDNCGWTIVKSITGIGGLNSNMNAVAEKKAFGIYQKLTGIPNGTYKALANGVYEGDENGEGTNPRFYVMDGSGNKTYKTFKHSDVTNDQYEWSRKFRDDKSYLLDTITVTVWDNTLTVGFEGERTDVKAIFDNAQLLYYGPWKDLSKLSNKYNGLRSQVNSMIKANKKMSAAAKQGLQDAFNQAPDVNSVSELNDAISVLSQAINAANASITVYGNLVGKYETEVSKLGPEGQAYWNENTRKPIIDAGLLVDEQQLKDGLKAATIVDRGVGKDITDLTIVNPSFETGSTSGWTIDNQASDTGAKEQSNGTYTMEGADGDWLYNSWNGWAGCPIHQTVTGLATGKYTLTAIMSSSSPDDEPLENGESNLVWLKAGDRATSLPAAHKTKGNLVSLDFEISDETSVEIMAYATYPTTQTTLRWFKVDDFHLIYKGAVDLSELKAQLYTAIGNATQMLKSKMNKTVERSLNTAMYAGEDVYNSSSSTKKDFETAIKNINTELKKAQESAAVYANINAVIEKGTKLDEAGKAQFNQFIETIKQKYSDGTITDGEAELQQAQQIYVTAIKVQTTEGTEMTEAVSNWECNSGYVAGQFGWGNRNQAVAKNWSIYDGDTYELKDLAWYFHVNTWSNEAELGTDGGTPMTMPFTEFWSTDGENYLGNNHIIIKHDTETGYTPGRYTIGIMARLAQCTANAESPSGYKFSANGIVSQTQYEHNSANVFYAFDEVDFFVDEDGKIDFQFEIDHSNFSWLAFKMIKLTYQGQNYSEKQANDMIADITEKYIGQQMNKDVEAALKSAINEFKNDHSVAVAQKMVKAGQDAANSIELYDYVYKELEKYYNKEAEYNNGRGFDEVGKKAFNQAMLAVYTAWEECTLTADSKEGAAEAYHRGLINQQATADATIDFTELIVNQGFEDGLTGWTYDTAADVRAGNAHDDNTYEMWVEPKDETIGTAPLYDKLFNIWNYDAGGMVKQTIKNIPNGKYKISAYIATDKGRSVFLFGNDDHSEPFTQTGDYAEAKKWAVLATVEVSVKHNELTLGAIGGAVRGDNMDYPDYPTEKGTWYKADDFHLEYMGPEDLSGLLAQLQKTLEYADDYINLPMSNTIYNPLKKDYDAAKKLTVGNTTADEINTYNDNILAYVETSKASIAIYESINAYFEEGAKLDETGQLTFKSLAKTVIDAYNNRTITDGTEEKSHLEWWLRTATKAQTGNNTNWTGAILNRSFEDRMQYWKTTSGHKSFSAKKNSDMKWNKSTGERYAYKDNKGGNSPIKVNFYQDIDTVAKGLYKVRATVYTDSKSISIYAGDLTGKITQCKDTSEVRYVEQLGVVWAKSGRLSIGIIGTLEPGEEVRVDNFELEYLSKDIDVEKEMVADDVKFNNSIKEKQREAVDNFYMDAQSDNLAKAIDAINEAKESAAKYKVAKFYLDSAWHYMLKSNVYTQASMDQCMNLWNSLNTNYQNGSLTNSDIDQMLYKFFQNGFEGFGSGNAGDPSIYKNYPILNYIFDAWTLNVWGEEYKANANFHVNTWSKEINPNNPTPENSEMIPPFIEYWTNKNDDALTDATIHAKAINLEEGLYKVKVLARVLNENNNIDPSEFTGVKMHVTTDRVSQNNGVPIFSSDTLDICKSGNVYTDGGYKVVSAEYVIDSVIVRKKDNHDAHVYFTVENANVNWLAWKFCQFERVRDLEFWEENDMASDEEIKTLKDLIARDEKKPIGFNVSEYSTYANRDIITAHNAAKKYLEENESLNQLTKYQVNEYIKALYEDPNDPTTRKWHTQNSDTNAIYNPHFWLVREGIYEELVGWNIKDNTFTGEEEKWLKTGGMPATCATADPYWTKFANIEGSVNYNGVQNTFSTAATFKFSEKNKFCSSKSVYSYGESTGFEMPLDQDQAYTFSAQIGFMVDDNYTGNKMGSATLEIVNARTNEVVMSEIITPNVCVSDTTDIPETFQFIFNTKKSSQTNYANTLENWNNLEKYKLVVRNTDPDVYWWMIISNIQLYRYPNAIMEIKAGAHWGTFIAPFDAKIPDNIHAFVVTGKDDKTHDYYDPNDETKKLATYTQLHISREFSNIVYKDGDQTITRNGSLSTVIPAHTPVVIYTDQEDHIWGVAGGKKALERVGEARYYRHDDTSIYLEGYEGVVDPTKPNTMTKIQAQNGSYVLQMHNTFEGESACFYKVDYASGNIPYVPANRCYLVDPNPSGSQVRMLLFSLDEAINNAIKIENSDNQNDEIEIVSVYSANGTVQQTLKKGVNILKMSDGSIIKKYIK